jgi:hypothetical protein
MGVNRRPDSSTPSPGNHRTRRPATAKLSMVFIKIFLNLAGGDDRDRAVGVVENRVLDRADAGGPRRSVGRNSAVPKVQRGHLHPPLRVRSRSFQLSVAGEGAVGHEASDTRSRDLGACQFGQREMADSLDAVISLTRVACRRFATTCASRWVTS